MTTTDNHAEGEHPVPETTTYRIRAEWLTDLERRFAALAKRADKLGVTPPGYTVTGSEDVPETAPAPDYEITGATEPTGRTITILHIAVHGDAPRYDGWRPIAVIDRDLEEPTAPNVVHPLDAALDPTWRSVGDYCDHCNPPTIARGRKALVVVEHDDATRKIVGTTCLRDFLGHSSPERIAAWVQMLASLDDLFGAWDPDAWDEDRGPRTEARYDPAHFLAATRAVIRDRGWVSRGKAYETGVDATADIVALLIDKRQVDIIDADRDAADAALAWAQEMDARDNDYLLNAQAVALKSGWRSRDIGFGASLVNAHQRELDRATERAALAVAQTAPVPEGAATIEGVVLSTRWVEGFRGGSTLKMTVLDDRGFRVWCSAPEAFHSQSYRDADGDYVDSRGVEPGDRVRFVATVTPKDGDPTFGFAKRPRKAERLWEGALA